MATVKQWSVSRNIRAHQQQQLQLVFNSGVAEGVAPRVRKEGRGCLRIAGRILYLLVPFHLFDDAKATGNAACMHACSSSSSSFFKRLLHASGYPFVRRYIHWAVE